MKSLLMLMVAMGISSASFGADDYFTKEHSKAAAQADQVKKSAMSSCMAVKKDQKACDDMVRTCEASQDVKGCMDSQVKTMRDKTGH